MKTTVKKLSDTKVQLTISLGASELADAEQTSLAKLARDIKVPGFRKGKVPASIAAKHIDPNVLQEQILENALSKAVAEAFLQEKLQALDRPSVEVKKFVPGSELEFTAEVEVIPPVKLGDYQKLIAKKEAAKVEDKDVDEVIERIRKNYSEKSEVKRAAKLGDEAVIDFTGKKDGVAFDGGSAKEYGLKLGEGQFIPGFEDQLVGAKEGDNVEVKVTFPEEYHAENLKGQDAVFKVTVHEVKTKELPELTDEFAKDVDDSVETLAELKEKFRKELEEAKAAAADEAVADEALRKAVENAEIVELPHEMVNDEVHRQMEH